MVTPIDPNTGQPIYAAPAADMPLDPGMAPPMQPGVAASVGPVPQMAAPPMQPMIDPNTGQPMMMPPQGAPHMAAPNMAAPHMAPQMDPQMAAMGQPGGAAMAPGMEGGMDPMMPQMHPEAAEAMQPAMAGAAYVPEDEDLSDIRPVPRVAIQAFCESEMVAQTIDRASQDRRMAKAHVKVEMGGIPAAVAHYESATTPNLILVETNLMGQALIGELTKLAEVCDEGTNVVVIGHKNDVQLYRDLIMRGVSEYLVAPVSMADVMEIVSTLFVNPEASPLGNTVAFIGSKGGVGSSTIAHNVAFTISSTFESDVILTDLDLAFGTANIDFDQDPATGVAEAVFSSDRIDETFFDRLLAKCSDHLSLLAAPSTLDREYDFDADDFAQLLEVAQRGTPNVIIDLPHVWTGWMKQILSAADKIVITATPDLASLRNTKNLVDTLAELRPNDDKPYLVLNQCNVPKRPEIPLDDFTQPLGIDPVVTVPFDPALFGQAANNGQMIAEANAKSEIAESFLTLSQVLTGRRTLEPKKKGGLGSIFSRFKRKKEDKK